jgi:hypothetical protein
MHYYIQTLSFDLLEIATLFPLSALKKRETNLY